MKATAPSICWPRWVCGESLPDEFPHSGGDKENEACPTERLGGLSGHRQSDARLSLIPEERHACDERGERQDGTAPDHDHESRQAAGFLFLPLLGGETLHVVVVLALIRAVADLQCTHGDPVPVFLYPDTSFPQKRGSRDFHD